MHKQFDLFEQPDRFDPKPEKPKKPKHIFEGAYDIEYSRFLEKDQFFPGEANRMANDLVKKLNRQYSAQRKTLQEAADDVYDEAHLPDFYEVAKSLMPQIHELERLREKGIFSKKKK